MNHKKIYQKTEYYIKHNILQRLQKLSFYDTILYYKKGLSDGVLGVRASAISFNMLLALFPGILVIFTLIPLIPIDSFQPELIALIKKILPPNTYILIEESIIDITTTRRIGLFSFGFAAALVFGVNALGAVIAAFNASANTMENRTWISMKGISFVLFLMMTLCISMATGLIVFGHHLLAVMEVGGIINNAFSQYLFTGGQWLVIILLILFSISFLYYLAPSSRSKYTFFSPGSLISTLLIILLSVAFSAYINRFGHFNKIYGSIGTFIVMMLWLKLSSFVLLIGFELNLSIRALK